MGEVRSRGLIACIELCKDKERHELFEPAGKVGVMCRELSIANGLVMRAIRDGMVLAPPLIVTETDIDEIVSKVHLTLGQLHSKLRAEGWLAP